MPLAEFSIATCSRNYPRGAAIFSTGRGDHLDQDALLADLESGHISSAILDVTAPEPLPSDHPLWEHPNVLITPHIASKPQVGTAVAALTQVALLAPANLADFEQHYFCASPPRGAP